MMIDAGYFALRVAATPTWLGVANVRDVCSASHHVSSAPDGWLERWLHNGFGWFNRASDAFAVVPADQTPEFRLFAYRIYPRRFSEGADHDFAWPEDVHPEPIPDAFRSLGFDSVSKSMESVLGFECSPLSCNSMATELAVNEHCLFASLEAAVAGATRFSTEQPEPGDYYVVEVLESTQAA
jgi:hypothetical protein